MALESSRVGLVLLHTVEVDLGCDVADDFLGRLCLSDATVFLLDVVHTVLGVVIKDVVGVCSGCILGEPDTTGHVGSEPDLVEEHRACCNDLKG